MLMYKCEVCGHLFGDGEQRTVTETYGFPDSLSERFNVCPLCGGDYQRVKQCHSCGDWHTEGKLFEGWCESCLKDSINYDTFYDYCESNMDNRYLDIFVMSELLGGMDCPDTVTLEFHGLMIEVYTKKSSDEKMYKALFGKSFTGFLPACVRFIMEDDGSIGRESYADWLNRQEVKN